MKWLSCLALCVGTAAACSSASSPGESTNADDAGVGDTGVAPVATYPTVVIAAEPQRAGDATKGYHALVNEAYVPCGVPDSAYSLV